MADTPPWAVAQDVRDRWLGEAPLSATDAQITTLIADVEDTILREFPDLPDRIDSTDPLEANPIPLSRVKKVVARIAIRHLRNPDGTRSRMEVAGPYTENVVYGGESPGSAYLTDEDRTELAGAVSGGKAFTIDQTPLFAPSSPSGWLDFGGTWL